jgi:hypothetical protein
MSRPQRIQYSDAIEPLVQFIEDTPPAEILDATLAKLRDGVSTETMLTASALAVTRSTDLPPGHHGGPLHPLAGLYAITNFVDRLEGEDKFLPVMQHVALSNKHINHPAISPYQLLEFAPTWFASVEAATAAFLGEAIGQVDEFSEVRALDANVLAIRLSIDATGEPSSISAEGLYARSLNDNPMEVHLNISSREVEQSHAYEDKDVSVQGKSRSNSTLGNSRIPPRDYRCGHMEDYADEDLESIRHRGDDCFGKPQRGGQVQCKNWRRPTTTNWTTAQRCGAPCHPQATRGEWLVIGERVRPIAVSGWQISSAVRHRARRNKFHGENFRGGATDLGCDYQNKREAIR